MAYKGEYKMANDDKQMKKIQEVLTGGFQSYPPVDKYDVIILKQVKAMKTMQMLSVRNLKSKRFLKAGGVKKF